MDTMYAAPALQNPPPQIFGAASSGAPAYNVDYTTSFLPDEYNYTFEDQAFDERGDGDQSDPKRRRIAKACDMCRKKKIKCDGKMPKCSHCENYKTECIFTQVEKKRAPPKGAKYIEGLENRLGRMEALLRMSGLLTDEDGGTDLGTLEKRLADRVAARSTSVASESIPNSPAGVRPEDHNSKHDGTRGSATPAAMAAQSSPTAAETNGAPKQERDVAALSAQMDSLVTNSSGETRFIGQIETGKCLAHIVLTLTGSSSGFSIFSPTGMQWVREKTGDDSFQTLVQNAAANDHQWYQWKPEVFNDVFARRTFQPLPPKQATLSLLKDFFENFNCMFPLFHEPTFMHLVEKQYSPEPYEGSGWWACLNVTLAIAHRMRVMSNVVPQEEDQLAWMYLKNALAVQSELTMRNNDLLSVQALLGMV